MLQIYDTSKDSNKNRYSKDLELLLYVVSFCYKALHKRILVANIKLTLTCTVKIPFKKLCSACFMPRKWLV